MNHTRTKHNKQYKSKQAHQLCIVNTNINNIKQDEELVLLKYLTACAGRKKTINKAFISLKISHSFLRRK